MRGRERDTIEQSRRRRSPTTNRPPMPGLVQVFANGGSHLAATVIGGQPLTIGRSSSCGVVLDDVRASREHAQVELTGGRWLVRDLDSRNGTFVDCERVSGVAEARDGAVVAVGSTVLLLAADVGPLLGAEVDVRDGVILGPRTRGVWDAIARAAATSDLLHITGETGTGKEVAARLFHDASARAQRSFVPVNCAAIPSAIAERLLFGARRGSYSGADADSDGYLVAAHGGTLFLDEVAELSLEVQAKLLRAIDAREVLPLGASKPRTVDVAICSATHVDLRVHVAAGRFREDLYFRLGAPSVALPPLRERREEIPWIIEATLRRVRPSLRAHASLVESALVRPWPGNVRELIHAITSAARAVEPGENLVEAMHLADRAGLRIPATQEPAERAPAAARQVAARAPRGPRIHGLARDVILDGLRREQGNISRAARTLGLHRTQLRRLMALHGIDPKQL